MEKALGHVFKYGDNVDTDVIIPARYLNSFDAQELASHAMVDIDPDFVKNVKKGDLIGEVVDPFEGTVKQQIRTAKGGLLFTLRAYPVVYEGDLLARILTE